MFPFSSSSSSPSLSSSYISPFSSSNVIYRSGLVLTQRAVVYFYLFFLFPSSVYLLYLLIDQPEAFPQLNWDERKRWVAGLAVSALCLGIVAALGRFNGRTVKEIAILGNDFVSSPATAGASGNAALPGSSSFPFNPTSSSEAAALSSLSSSSASSSNRSSLNLGGGRRIKVTTVGVWKSDEYLHDLDGVLPPSAWTGWEKASIIRLNIVDVMNGIEGSTGNGRVTTYWLFPSTNRVMEHKRLQFDNFMRYNRFQY